MEIKRMRRTRRDTMADMESIKDLTSLDIDFQYLRARKTGNKAVIKLHCQDRITKYWLLR